MTSLFDPATLLADIDAADEAEAKALAERQRKRRAALEPAARLYQQIATARAEFLTRETELLDQLAAALKEARKNGAPHDKLDQLHIPALTTKPGSKKTPTKRPATKKAPTRTKPGPDATSTSLAS